MSDDCLSDEDKALFRKTVGAIKPLQENKKVDFPVQRTSLPKAKIRDKGPSGANSTLIYLSDHYTETVQADSVLSYCNHSIPIKRLRELRSGQIQWDARLDLHGLRPEGAKETLIKFIFEQSAFGHRCLLIIHGKGSHQGESPVLKNLVNHWLKQFPQVLAFYSALSRDGGSGALYVLLKRPRNK